MEKKSKSEYMKKIKNNINKSHIGSVSVIIPCYNYARFLPECLKSVLSQENVKLNVLVIDDASTDNSAKVAKEWAKKDSRIEVIIHKKNKGHIATFNEGLKWATNDYTVLISSDDMLTPGSLARAASLMDSRPEVGFVYGSAILIKEGETPRKPRTGSIKNYIISGQKWIEYRCKSGKNCIASPECMTRTSLQHKLGGYFSFLPHADDFEMWLRFAAHSDVGFINGADQAYYTVHSDSMSNSTFHDPLIRKQQEKLAFDTLFSRHSKFIHDANRLHKLVNKKLAKLTLIQALHSYCKEGVSETKVDQLINFSIETCPSITNSPIYIVLTQRRKLGHFILLLTNKFYRDMENFPHSISRILPNHIKDYWAIVCL